MMAHKIPFDEQEYAEIARKQYLEYEHNDHDRLHACISKVKGRFVLSCNDDPAIRKLYEAYHIHEMERKNKLANKKGKAAFYRKLIITNFACFFCNCLLKRFRIFIQIGSIIDFP